ncbi:DUF4198 domain-containing protein [Niveispirillum sp.]|uniref:DUF4198 domain-containing protein n=1 Tax=Niveispirillum sp. TaxID=1917217 RepID=UPI001B628141|nr:DUF4198 domain-containing protein [Niveispirillum sp.]MBP7334763.1 DUF4198 domain-containing protein [Niveispirillum sp.]
MHRPAAALAVLLLIAGPAAAHTGYLKPNLFNTPQRDHITVEGAFAEEMFVPDVVMKADDYHVVTPSGAKVKLPAVTYLRDLALFEVDLPETGTYRISTGVREGAKRKMALVNGKWEPLREREGAPAGARVAEAQSITRSDVYVSKGPASDKALTPAGTGLEIIPLAHPNRLDAGAALPVRLLLDGKPVAGVAISLHGPGLPDEEHAKAVTVTTDKDGKASIALPGEGAFLLLARHRVEAADGPVAVKSHSATLTFAVGA